MSMIRKTFTIDEACDARLRQTAERLGKAQSEVVRQAILDYAARAGRLSERERLELLATFDEVISRIPKRPLAEVKREIVEVRAARRAGGRRSGKRSR